ncbi:MAG: 50S ribosomal protein L11 methyltransferase [Candidatus Omnitrophica bacterium]|nr:50S ribosomal protein L11 methyltransferase [Candidatus Omnitrophota bacterium]
MSKTFQITFLIKTADLLGAADILRDVLVLDLKIDRYAIIERVTKKNISLMVFSSSSSRSKNILDKFKKLNLKHVIARYSEMDNEYWQNKWKEDFKPFALTSDIVVVPAWLKSTYCHKKSKKIIYIDSNLAFGTGMHETTRFMSELIESLKGKFNSFLDIGTGTGILALVALNCGATDMMALDISEDCIKNADENLRFNGYNDYVLLTGDFGGSKINKKFDLVAANLVSLELLAMADKIIKCVKIGGYLAVSGISHDNFKKVKMVFAQSLKPVSVKKGKDWNAILFKKGT